MMRGLLLATVCLVTACSLLPPGKNERGRECRSYCNEVVTECLGECNQDRTCQAACKSAVLDPCISDRLGPRFRVGARQPN